MPRARRSAKRASALRRRTARPKRRSTCRSSCATTSRGWRFPASARPARCNCSTSAGAAAPSASSRARPATPRSRCWRRPSISPARWRRSPMCGSATRARRSRCITQFLDQKLPMIVMADVGTLSPEIRDRLNAWIDQGGVLVRFAGPRLAQGDDDLVPVKLRRGGRTLGGSLTWEKPQHLAAFAADGPFAGLAVPKDVTVSRQVLAEPDAGARDQELGLARRRHAAGHRRASRQGIGQRCSMSAPICAGPTCRCRAPSSRCCGGSSISPATPRRPDAGVAGETRPRRRWRRCIRSTASARSARRPSTAKPLPADYRDRATAGSSAGLLWPRRRTARGQHARRRRPHRRRSTPPRCKAQRASYTNAEPRDLRGMLLSAALALFLIDAIIVAMLGAGIAALLAAARGAGRARCSRSSRSAR